MGNKELLTDETLQKMKFSEKLTLVKRLTTNIIAYPAFAYKKLKDMLRLCADTNIDVVLKATNSLCDIFCDILPDYRIRQFDPKDEESKKEKVSKDVQQLRSQEQALLESYKEYLTILETFSKIKTAKLTKEQTTVNNYDRLKHLSVFSFCRLLERHPNFNYRLNILQIVASKLASQDLEIRRACTLAFKNILRKDDNNILEFKLDTLKEMHKVIKQKPHNLFDQSLLDSLSLHEIMVDESKAKAIDDATKNAT